MKPSLFILPLLAVCAVQAEVLFPSSYTRVDIDSPTDFKIGTIGSRNYGDKLYAFVLETDLKLENDTAASALMNNGYIYITSDTTAPVDFTATELTVRVLDSTKTGTSASKRTYQWTGLDNVTISKNRVISVSGSKTSTKDTRAVRGMLSGSGNYQAFSISKNEGKITISDNIAENPVNNTLHVYGAAIAATGQGSSITIDGNAGGVTITNNRAQENAGSTKIAAGGALYGYSGISVSENRGVVDLSANTAESSFRAIGGLATLQSSAFEVSENTEGVKIDNNTAKSTKSESTYNWLADGGAISSYSSSSVGVKILDNQGGVSISDNKAITSGAGASGGAMSVGYVDISGNKGELIIQNNYTESSLSMSSSLSSKGGAFYVIGSSASSGSAAAALRISDNETVTISGNHADTKAGSAAGGVVYGYGSLSKVDISGNGTVDISGNYASGVSGAQGGAIYTRAGVFIEGNESVTLAGNYEKVTDPATGAVTYRLRSIYQDYSSITTDASQLENSQFRLMAAKGNTIEIQDSVYSNRRKIDVVFNGSYGEMEKGEGTIRFTGKYTESVLQELKDGCNVTAEEIVASRTSEFASEIKLMGGRLELTDEACLKGVGFNAAAGSGAVLSLQNATFENKFINESYLQTGIVTFNSGTTLEVAGINNTLTAQTLNMEDNSTMKFMLSEDAATSSMLTLDVAGGLTKDVFDNIIIELSGVRTVGEGTYHLLSLSDSCSYVPDIDWDESKITLAGVTDASLLWSGNDLMVIIVPEPATATLSLLALSMLSARRRRK